MLGAEFVCGLGLYEDYCYVRTELHVDYGYVRTGVI